MAAVMPFGWRRNARLGAFRRGVPLPVPLRDRVLVAAATAIDGDGRRTSVSAQLLQTQVSRATRWRMLKAQAEGRLDARPSGMHYDVPPINISREIEIDYPSKPSTSLHDWSTIRLLV